MDGNFQRLAVAQGKAGEDIAEIQLVDADLEIVGQHIQIDGVEADFQVRTRDQVDVYVTVKWSVRGGRPGALRTDTLKKAIAEAWAMKHETNGYVPVVLMTSHIPTRGYGKKLLQAAIDGELFDLVVNMSDPQSVAQLETLHAR